MRMREIMQIVEGASQAIWFHRTTQDRLDSIMQNGLVVGSEPNLTEGGEWSFRVYGTAPIFLSQKPDTFYEPHAPVLLAIDISAVHPVADLPSLVDQGAYYDIDDWCMWWKGEDEEFSFDELLTPDSAACQMAISRTGTAASLENIPPSAIKVIR